MATADANAIPARSKAVQKRSGVCPLALRPALALGCGDLLPGFWGHGRTAPLFLWLRLNPCIWALAAHQEGQFLLHFFDLFCEFEGQPKLGDGRNIGHRFLNAATRLKFNEEVVK